MSSEVGRSYKVVVIGAGVAGISAAHFLVSNGIRDVVLLESRDRIGGRVHTVGGAKAGGGGSGKIELGAEWIRGGCPANSLFNLANR